MFESMLEHFREGGWVMYPVFGLGVLAVGAAGRFAWRGEHQLLGFIRWITLSVLGAGAFGFCAGMLLVLSCATLDACMSLHHTDRGAVLLIGTREALNLPTAALMFVVLTCLLVGVGQRRFPLPNPSAVPR